MRHRAPPCSPAQEKNEDSNENSSSSQLEPYDMQRLYQASYKHLQGHMKNYVLFMPERDESDALVDANALKVFQRTMEVCPKSASFLVFPIWTNVETLMMIYNKQSHQFTMFSWVPSKISIASLTGSSAINIALPSSISAELKPLFVLDLVESVFIHFQQHNKPPTDNYAGILSEIALRFTNKVQVVDFRRSIAEERPSKEIVDGRGPKAAVIIIMLIVNIGMVAFLWYYHSDLIAAWVFFSVFMVSFIPKIYGSCRYHNHENAKERKGYYRDLTYLTTSKPSQSQPKNHTVINMESKALPRSVGDPQSPIFVAANTPMYDESEDELRRTFDSYNDVMSQVDALEVTFLIDRKEHTFDSMLSFLCGPANIVKRGRYSFINSIPPISLRLLADQRVLYCGPWPGRPNCRFNLVWKPNGGGKRDSQLQFLSLLRHNIVTRPRDTVLYVDADTSFRCEDVRALYSAMMKKPKCGLACGEIRVSNKRTNVLTWAQSYEYMVNHMLAKASESWFHMVLCCPGAWCMYRVQVIDQVLEKYSRQPSGIREYHRLEQGEDRYQDTLALKHGWQARMVKSSVAHTHVPDSLLRLTEQRRRWNNSTLENNVVVLGLGVLWRRSPIYMISLVFDLVGYFLYPAIFITLFANTLAVATAILSGWPLDYTKYGFYGAMTFYFLLQLTLFMMPIRSVSLRGFFYFCAIFSAIMMLAIGVFLLTPFVIPPNIINQTITNIRPPRPPPSSNPNKPPGVGRPPVKRYDASEEYININKRATEEIESTLQGLGRPPSQIPPPPTPPALIMSPSDSNITNATIVLNYVTEVANYLKIQIPLLGGLIIYAVVLFVSSFRFRGWYGVGLVIFGGIIYVFFLPTFYFTFLLFSLARYDSTSWR